MWRKFTALGLTFVVLDGFSAGVGLAAAGLSIVDVYREGACFLLLLSVLFIALSLVAAHGVWHRLHAGRQSGDPARTI